MKLEINAETAEKISEILRLKPGMTINNAIRELIGIPADKYTREHSEYVGVKIALAHDVVVALKKKHPGLSVQNAIRRELGLTEIIKSPWRAFRQITADEVRRQKPGDVIELDMSRLSHLPIDAKTRIAERICNDVKSYALGYGLKFFYEWDGGDMFRISCLSGPLVPERSENANTQSF